MKTKTEIPMYYSDELRESVIQLHDNHTFWQIDNEKLNNISGLEFESEIQIVIDGLQEFFYDKFKTEFYLLGRSGRHCCVNDNDFNRRHYKSMRNYALKLEKMFIEHFNNYE